MSTANYIEDLHTIINHFLEEMLLCQILDFLITLLLFLLILDYWRMHPAYWVYILQLFILQEHVLKEVNSILIERIILLHKLLERSYPHRKHSQTLFKLRVYYRHSDIVYVLQI